MNVILVNTLPRTGANKLINSLSNSLKSLNPSLTIIVYDLDLLESNNIKIEEIKGFYSNDPKIYILKTHKRESFIFENFNLMKNARFIVLNSIRCPFDIGVSTYYYLLRRWRLIDDTNIKLKDYLCKWADLDGNDMHFINQNIPSFNEYVQNVLKLHADSRINRLVLTYDNLLNSIDGSLESIYKKTLEVFDNLSLNKIFMLDKLVLFSLDDARRILGNEFIFNGSSNYSKNQMVIDNLQEDAYIDLKNFYHNKFEENINKLNDQLNIKIGVF